jgi:hypothetical protein
VVHFGDDVISASNFRIQQNEQMQNTNMVALS